MGGKLCGGAEDVKARASLSHSIGESQGGDRNLRPETGWARKWNVGARRWRGSANWSLVAVQLALILGDMSS